MPHIDIQIDTDFYRINPRAGLVHLLTHCALILGTMALARWGHMIFAIPLGFMLGALFPLMHEASHRHVFKGVAANKMVAFWAGTVLLLPATWFRHFHQAHHRHTQNPDRDPELMCPRPASLAAYLWHMTGIPAWISSGSLLILQAFGRVKAPFLPVRHHRQVVMEARLILSVHIGLLVAMFLGLSAIFWLFYLPLLIGQVFLRAFLLAEHGGLPFVDHVMENTRTTRAARWLRWLTWNMSYHTEHHLSPGIPHDKLPAFHAHLNPPTCLSYGSFHRGFLRNLLQARG